MARASANSNAPTREQVLALAPSGKLEIKVTPNANDNALYIRKNDASPALLCARVCVAPEDGKANAAVIKLLAKALAIPKSRISVIRGHNSRTKLLAIDS